MWIMLPAKAGTAEAIQRAAKSIVARTRGRIMRWALLCREAFGRKARRGERVDEGSLPRLRARGNRRRERRLDLVENAAVALLLLRAEERAPRRGPPDLPEGPRRVAAPDRGRL